MHPSPTTGSLACLLKMAEFVQSLYYSLLGDLTRVTLVDSRQFLLHKVSHTSILSKSNNLSSDTLQPLPHLIIVYFILLLPLQNQHYDILAHLFVLVLWICMCFNMSQL